MNKLILFFSLLACLHSSAQIVYIPNTTGGKSYGIKYPKEHYKIAAFRMSPPKKDIAKVTENDTTQHARDSSVIYRKFYENQTLPVKEITHEKKKENKKTDVSEKINGTDEDYPQNYLASAEFLWINSKERVSQEKNLKKESNIVSKNQSDDNYCVSCLSGVASVGKLKTQLKALRSAYQLGRLYYVQGTLGTATNLDTLKSKWSLAKDTLYDNWVQKVPFRFFPGRNTDFTARFYGKSNDRAFDAFKNGFLDVDPRFGVSYYNEFIAGYIGPFRLGLGGMFSKNNLATLDSSVINGLPRDTSFSRVLAQKADSVNKINNYTNSIQQLIAGGGNLVINVDMPLCDISSCL